MGARGVGMIGAHGLRIDSAVDVDPRYRSTRWSLIDRAQHGSDEARTQAMDQIVRLYWRPVYWTLRRGWQRDRQDAAELTQQFFLYFLERELIQGVRKARGRFRGWIKGTLRNFMREHARNARRLKRGGGRVLVPLDDLMGIEAAPPSTDIASDRLFERELMRSLIREALEELSVRMEREGRHERFMVFRHYYFEEAQGHRLTYDELGEHFGMSFHEVKNALAEMRVAYRITLLNLMGSPGATQEETIHEILEVFRVP